MSSRPAVAASRLSAVVWSIAFGKLAIHLAFIRGYGWFRDEFYYIACSEHLAWGYVDHPPAIALVTATTRALLGDSIVALRLVPAAAGALTVVLTGVLARDLGARRWGQAIAALSVAIAPIYLSLNHFLSMNAFEPLAWTLFALLVLRAVRSGRLATWTWAGVVAGVGLETKHSMAFMGAALALGLLLSPARRVFRQRGPWLCALVAGAIALPNAVWEVQHGWPTLEFMRNAQQHKNLALPAGRFVLEQLLALNPVSAVVWVAGLVWLLVSPPLREWRALAWAYLALLLLFVGTGAKPYYLSPYYPILFAAGGVCLQNATVRGRGGAVVRVALPVLLVISGIAIAPLALPILPIDSYVRYAARLGVTQTSGERHEQGRLPQFFADMIGWPALVGAVTRAAETLPAAERARAVILVGNYGEAGAINFLGDDRTPRAISGHNNYWLWGPGNASSGVLLLLGGAADDHPECGSLERAGTVECGDCMPYENHQAIWICRNRQPSIQADWAEQKHFQ